jgi:hypothetical protein
LRIEEVLGSKARFAGLDEMPMRRQAAGVVGAVADRAAALIERGYSGGGA